MPNPFEMVPAPSARGWRRRLRRIALVLLIVNMVLAGVFHRFLFLGNVEELDGGRVVRCAQPKGNLEHLIETYRPASILNLRGGSYSDGWYLAEVQASKAHEIDFYDFPMVATERPSRLELLTLIDLLRRCRYPLLIHCKSGSDRTGLVSGLYLLTQRGAEPRRALQEFSLWRGHIPMFGPQRLHEPLLEYEAWLQSQGLRHSPALLQSWAENHYQDDNPRPSFQPLRPGPRYYTLATDAQGRPAGTRN